MAVVGAMISSDQTTKRTSTRRLTTLDRVRAMRSYSRFSSQSLAKSLRTPITNSSSTQDRARVPCSHVANVPLVICISSSPSAAFHAVSGDNVPLFISLPSASGQPPGVQQPRLTRLKWYRTDVQRREDPFSGREWIPLPKSPYDPPHCHAGAGYPANRPIIRFSSAIPMVWAF